MYVENKEQVVRVWRYVEAKATTADELYNILIRLVTAEKNPNFMNYFKTRLASIATDGASNMVGQYNSLVTKLRSYINTPPNARPLQSYHCNNHVLALAYNDFVYSSDPELGFCKTIINHCNRLSRFYSTKAYRRREELYQTAAESGDSLRKFRRIQKVRWVPATQLSYSIVDQNYKSFMSHLSKLKNDISITHENRREANNLYNIFVDKNLIGTIYHHLDVIAELSKWAKWMERKTNSIIDVAEISENVRLTTESLLVVPGKHLERFLAECRCNGVPFSLQSFESTSVVNFRGQLLTNSGSNIPKLSQSRPAILQQLIASFEVRFPKESISAFSVLNPRTVSASSADDWNKLAEYFRKYYNFPLTIHSELQTLKHTIVSDTNLQQHIRLPPEKFWSKLLMEVEFSETIQQVIKIALVQPAGTSQVL